LKSAIDFLRAHFIGSIGWQEYRTLAGLAVDWPTAYVGSALLAAGALDTANAAIAPLLAGQNMTGGWGYHRDVPDDLDSTAYAVMFLAETQGVTEACARGVARIVCQQRADGGFATYGDGTAIRAFMDLPRSISLDGWTNAHPEVTASVGRALTIAGEIAAAHRAWNQLARVQRNDGRWRSYWWTTDMYATAQAVQLARALQVGDGAIRHAQQWCAGQQRSDGSWSDGHSGRSSVLASALALIVLKDGGPGDAVARGRAWLLSVRRQDGGWDGEHALRLPPPWVEDPTEWTSWTPDALAAGALVRDEGGTYVTATALRALVS
jgi:squalene-hopene/tetraprenyl-beta-curcumene cyclase